MSLSAHTLFSALFPYLQSIHKITLQRRKTTILENAKQTNKNVQRVSFVIDKYRKIYSVKVI